MAPQAPEERRRKGKTATCTRSHSVTRYHGGPQNLPRRSQATLLHGVRSMGCTMCTSRAVMTQRRLVVSAVMLALSGIAIATVPEEELLASYNKVQEEYRKSGFRWLTPQQYSNIDLATNTKPFMFTFLSSRCWLCRGLLKHFATMEDPVWLNQLSSQFHAVMIFDSMGWEFVSPKYTPEGMDYVPRTLFATPNGTVRTDLVSRNASPENQHYYLPRELLFQMYSVLNEMYHKTEPYPSDLVDDLPS